MSGIKEKTENELVEEIKSTSCNDCFNELFDRHKRIYFDVCTSFCKKTNKLKYEELGDDAYFVFNQAVQNFDPNKKTKFTTYLYNCSRFFVLSKMNKIGKSAIVDFDDEDIKDFVCEGFIRENEFDINGDMLVKEEIFNLLDEMRDKRIKKIFEMRFYGEGEEAKWKNISGALDMTPQRAHMLFNEGKRYLERKFDL